MGLSLRNHTYPLQSNTAVIPSDLALFEQPLLAGISATFFSNPELLTTVVARVAEVAVDGVKSAFSCLTSDSEPAPQSPLIDSSASCVFATLALGSGQPPLQVLGAAFALDCVHSSANASPINITSETKEAPNANHTSFTNVNTHGGTGTPTSSPISSPQTLFHPEVPATMFVKMGLRETEFPESWRAPFNKMRDPTIPVTHQLLRDALSYGPFVAETDIGPNFYADEPTIFLNQIREAPQLAVHGWKPGATRKPSCPTSTNPTQPCFQDVIVVGTQKQGDKEHVYYVLAEHMIEASLMKIGIMSIEPLQETAGKVKVYVSSIDTFSNGLFRALPPATETEKEQVSTQRKTLQNAIEQLKKELETDTTL